MTECVVQLIYNSIDAKSTLIQVQIDLDNYNCVVSDNGTGINVADLSLIGRR